MYQLFYISISSIPSQYRTNHSHLNCNNLLLKCESPTTLDLIHTRISHQKSFTQVWVTKTLDLIYTRISQSRSPTKSNNGSDTICWRARQQQWTKRARSLRNLDTVSRNDNTTCTCRYPTQTRLDLGDDDLIECGCRFSPKLKLDSGDRFGGVDIHPALISTLLVILLSFLNFIYVYIFNIFLY